MLSWRSSQRARIASWILRRRVCSGDRNIRRTSCWVMVLPPSRMPPACQLRQAARENAARIDAAVLVEAPVLDGEDGLRQVIRQIGCCELGTLEHAAGGKGLAVIGFDHQGARGRIDLQAAVQGQGGDAVPDDHDKQDCHRPADNQDMAQPNPSDKVQDNLPGPSRWARSRPAPWCSCGYCMNRPSAGMLDATICCGARPCNGGVKEGLCVPKGAPQPAGLREEPSGAREGRAWARSVRECPGAGRPRPGCPLLSPSSPPVWISYYSICHNPALRSAVPGTRCASLVPCGLGQLP